MIDTPQENQLSPEFRALTIVTAAMAETMARAGLLDTFIVRLQSVSADAAEGLPPDDPALKWVETITLQLLRS